VAGLEVEESEADLVVQQWQESYEALSAEKAELDEKLETLPLEHQTLVSDRDHYRSQIGPLQLKVQVLEVKNAELENNASRLAILESKLQS
jgi:predicted nuclease with TOPRIM domain